MLKNSLLVATCAIPFLISCNNDSTGKKTEETTSNMSSPFSLPAKEKFDTTVDGKTVTLFYLSNNNNFKAAVTNYGARMVGFLVPAKDGKQVDVVVGFDNSKDFVSAEERYFGAIVGRFANRIAKGKFTLDGKTYQLDLNNGVNSLHGGRTGFHSRVWDAVQPDSQTVVLTHVSKDGEEGYPGSMTTKMTYRLTN